MRFEEYRQLDGTAIGSAVNKGELDPFEVLNCAIERAVLVNPKINAITCELYEYARQTLNTNRCEGVFAGVPVLLKDLLGQLKGFHTGGGTRAHKGEPAEHTSTLFRRYADMGMVFIGKTSAPELGLLATTEPVAHGPTRNPWDLRRSTGGSSGGSAAAISAGIVPMASAGDGGGSIRIPASCCGLFGFKPTRGINPMGPLPQSWDGAVSEHMLTRSVRDSLAVLRGSVGTDAASHQPGLFDEHFLDGADQPLPKRKRVGFTCESFYGGAVSQSCRDAVMSVADKLGAMGMEVEEIALDLDADALLAAYVDIYAANVNGEVAELISRYGRRFVRQHVEPLTYFIYMVGQSFSAGQYVLSQRYWSQLSMAMDSCHDHHDVIMTPTMAMEPYPIGDMDSSPFEKALMTALNWSGLSRFVDRSMLYAFSLEQLKKVPFTQLANLTGQPAMSVPLGWGSAGLPIGVQFIGRRLSDAALFQLAFALEREMPWFDRVPNL